MSSQLSPRNLLTIGVGSVSYVTFIAFSAIVSVIDNPKAITIPTLSRHKKRIDDPLTPNLPYAEPQTSNSNLSALY